MKTFPLTMQPLPRREPSDILQFLMSMSDIDLFPFYENMELNSSVAG